MPLKSWCQSRNEDNEDSLNVTTTFLGSSCMKGFFIYAVFLRSIYSFRKWQKYHFFILFLLSLFQCRQPLFIVFLPEMSFSIWVLLKKPFYPRTCSKLCILPTFLKHQPRRNLVGIFKGEIILI